MAVLTMRCARQPVEAHGNGFRLFPRLWRLRHLRPVATGCIHGAPSRLHPALSAMATSPGGATPPAAEPPEQEQRLVGTFRFQAPS